MAFVGVKRARKRKMNIESTIAFFARTKEHFTFSLQGKTQYEGEEAMVEVRITPDELGILLDRWGVVELIRSGTGRK